MELYYETRNKLFLWDKYKHIDPEYVELDKKLTKAEMHEMRFRDKEFKDKLYSTADALDLLAKNLNKIMDNGNAEAIASDLRITMRNVNEISGYINSMTKDDNLKKDLSYTVNTVNKAMTDISTTLASLNNLTPENKTEIQQIIEDTSVTPDGTIVEAVGSRVDARIGTQIEQFAQQLFNELNSTPEVELSRELDDVDGMNDNNDKPQQI